MNDTATILIVDDSKENINILLSMLEGYDLLVALNGPKALKLVEKNEIDLILLDIMMPEMDGYEVCRELKSRKETKDIPVLFITARTDEDSIELAFENGAVDYVTKPFKPRELLARVKTHIKLCRTIKALEIAATQDPLTGISNRRDFFTKGEKMMDNTSESLFAVMIDIDRFKCINDTYGHSFGDEIIRLVADTISQLQPDGSVFGRIGGEEFAMLLYASSREEVTAYTEHMRERISRARLPHGDQDVKISVSIGIAQRQKGDTLDTLLHRSDQALYRAKGTGRNRVCFRIHSSKN